MLIKKNGHLIDTEKNRIIALLLDSDTIVVCGYAVVVENALDIDSYVQSIYNEAREFVNNYLIPGYYYLIFQDACINVFTIVKD